MKADNSRNSKQRPTSTKSEWIWNFLFFLLSPTRYSCFKAVLCYCANVLLYANAIWVCLCTFAVSAERASATLHRTNEPASYVRETTTPMTRFNFWEQKPHAIDAKTITWASSWVRGWQVTCRTWALPETNETSYFVEQRPANILHLSCVAPWAYRAHARKIQVIPPKFLVMNVLSFQARSVSCDGKWKSSVAAKGGSLFATPPPVTFYGTHERPLVWHRCIV